MPQYPILQENLKPQNYYPKAPLTQLMRVYDELTALGLYVLPKQTTKKLPVIRYWKKENPVICTREMALQDQRNDANVSGWCIATGERSNRLIVIDFDTEEINIHGVDPVMIYEYVQELSPCDFVLASPSGGVHLYYILPDDFPMIGNSKPLKGIDVRGNGGQVVTLLGYNRYDNTPDDNTADKKGVPSGHCATYRKLPDGKYNTIPFMTKELYEWLLRDRTKETKHAHPDVVAGRQYARTEQGQARLEKHFKQPFKDRERVILECLGFILAEWDDNKTYEQWYQLWMSAHHGCDGSPLVRDLLLTHPNIYYRDGDKGRFHFRQAWDTLPVRETDGYTVASLFWLARRAGWLMHTGYEIPDRLVTKFSSRYITSWLETLPEIPNRVLLQSQTGSGKTYAIDHIWNSLGRPKAVVFVPSVKLATELANTLIQRHNIPATLYIDLEDNKAIPTEDLIKAQFLVTTLQTFSTKVFNAGVPLAAYGFVYIEECDQLFQQFARGDGGMYGSHVSGREARLGYAVLREAYEASGVVWGVDATMSRVSYDLAESLKAHHTIHVYRNEWVEPKAPVTILGSQGEAYQEVLKALIEGKNVVVPADTAHTAEEIVSIMVEIGVVTPEETIAITRPSERLPKVRAFMEDVNKEAAKYRLIAYNSCMASGVSIVDVTPDVIVQICTYLSPRNNLQLLNRFRKQKVVYCYYRRGENLYGQSAQEVLSDAERRAWIESAQVQIPLAVRNDDAQLRAHIASLSIGDEHQQQRSPLEFYEALLRGDGRKVTRANGEEVSGILALSRDAVKKARKEYAEQLKESWKDIPPIDRTRPALASYTPLEIAKGEIHATIERALRGNIPLDTDPKEVYDTVHEFVNVIAPLSAFVEQDRALQKAEHYLADNGKAITALTTNITLIRVLANLHYLYHSVDEVLTTETLKDRAPVFMGAMLASKESYDAINHRKEQSFDMVYSRDDNDIDRAVNFAKILLARIGLKQRMKRTGRTEKAYSIENIEAAKRFLSWRMPERELSFSDAVIAQVINERIDHVKVFEGMTNQEKDRVMHLLTRERYTDFKLAVETVNNNDDMRF